DHFSLIFICSDSTACCQPSPRRSNLDVFYFFFLLTRLSPISTLFPYTTLFRSRFGKVATNNLAGFWHQYADNTRFTTTFTVSTRSEEHTSELQSRFDLVCRLLLEKKKTIDSNKQGDACRCACGEYEWQASPRLG